MEWELDVLVEGAAAPEGQATPTPLYTDEQFQEIMAHTVQMVWEDGPEDEHK